MKGGETLGNAQLLLAEESSQFLFSLSWQSIFDALILAVNIFVLFVLLSYLLVNPLKDMLKKRQEKIAQDRDSAIKDRDEAKKLKASYDEKLKDIHKEAEAIMSEARKKAMKNEEKIIADAKAEAARIIERANAEIELEKKKAADEMKKEIIEVATIMANKVVAASIDKKTQDALIEETLREIGDKTWLS